MTTGTILDQILDAKRAAVSDPIKPVALGTQIVDVAPSGNRLLARAHPHGRWVHHVDVGA
jgi:hypothetical protein